MCVLRGNRVEIRPLRLEDVYEMQKWGKHDNPLFNDYNFPVLSEEEVKKWFKVKTIRSGKKCYGILDENKRVIGYLAIKDIKKFRKHAKLGIVFDPNYLNRGYGTEAIRVFLDYFFYQLNMKTMYLDVARHNKRAIRCYEKCGFQRFKDYVEKLEDQNIDIFDDEGLNKLRDDFVINKGIKYGYHYEMKVIKESYEKLFHKVKNNQDDNVMESY